MTSAWLKRGAVLMLVAVLAAVGGARWARSQPALPDGAFVAGQDGTRWIVNNGVRYRMSFIVDDANALPAMRESSTVVATLGEANAAVAAAPSPAAAAAPVAAGPANPAETLVGQRATVCNYGVELELEVARVEWIKTVIGQTAPGNAMWVVAFINVTNLSAKDEALYGAPSARVTDERGRQFDWKVYPPDPVDLGRAYSVKGHYENFAPGITEMTVATFQVPSDVRSLTLGGKRDLCL